MNNDIVYCKRNIGDKWKGPTKVIGQDGPVVFLWHQGFLIYFLIPYLSRKLT